MIEFHDFDPANPYAISNERHAISGNMITLDHLPQKGSVTIEGFTETSGPPSVGEFRVDYGYNGNYRTSMQTVTFAAGYDGMEVSVSYNGIGTLLRAKHINELRAFMETGASELAARLFVTYKEAMSEILETHCRHITDALREVASAIAAAGQGGQGGGSTDQLNIANDEEVDEMLDEFFPGDVEPTEESMEIASDEEADEMLDEFFPGDVEPAEDDFGIEGIASDEEFQSMLDEIMPVESNV